MSTVLSFISDFLLGFRLWLQNSMPLELIGILIIPIIVDYLRSVGKSIFLIFHTMYLKTTRHARGATGTTPSVSIIIPAHNEERTIVRSIESALETNYQNKEIIVVDDGSKDKTRDKALPYANKGLIKLIIRDVASGSKAGAVNHGLFYARNDIVIVVDADTLIERNSIKKLVKYFADPSVTAVSGNVRILRGDSGKNNLLVKLQAYEYIMSLEMGRRYGAITKSILIIPGAFGALKRKLALSVGGYDKDTITEDFDLTIKMRKLKGRIHFAGEAVSWTFAPDTWNAWRRQRVRWTRGQIETFNKHKNIFLKQRFSLSLVMAWPTLRSIRVSKRRSRFVNIPTNFLSCVTGIPDILYVAIRWCASRMVCSGEIVMGERIIPLSDFLTLSTSAAWLSGGSAR